ncbi:MAG: aminotransferase class I/II-fold pyridoxal phosphate-dependent enzyme [Gemmatimonadales bacterium]|nr:aminotransferase class I/II-fold pyridoxal phosphate-dependent enzyme [Gemmatimonadales bacterium]
MERRAFLRAGMSVSLLGLSGTRTAHARPPRAITAQTASSIRLSSNENPLGIAPAARDAIIRGLDEANRYPRLRAELHEVLAGKLGVTTRNVVLGAGSTEVLKLAVEAFAGSPGTLVLASPTYEDAEWYASVEGIRVEKVPLRADYSHDIPAMHALAARLQGPVCVYLCNPNNPTGTVTSSAEIDDWIGTAPDHVSFLVDEAYIDFVEDPGYHSALPWIDRKPNVLVARTFSKVHGMAGVRLGYGLVHEDAVESLRRRQVRNNANHLALVAGLASLESDEFVAQSLRVNRHGREIACACFRELGLEYLPSQTNFVMHRIGGDLRTHITRMREHGFQVGRPFPPMLEYNRVSIGLPEEMELFAETLRSFRQQGWV